LTYINDIWLVRLYGIGASFCKKKLSLIGLGKGMIMSRRTIVLLAVSAIFGIASVATASTDALAAKKKVRHHAAAAVVVAPAAAVVIDNNYGPVADRIPRCFDSAVLYPYPPCY
jgi:hypothetical protein